LCLFLSGYFSYLLFKHATKCDRKYLNGLLSSAVLLSLFVVYSRINPKYALAVLTVTLVLAMPFIFNLSKDARIDRFLGNISFPIYMVHFLVIEFIDDYVNEYSLWTILPVVLVIALTIYYGIERPIDCWRQRRVEPSRGSNDHPWCGPIPSLKAKT
jgi:peptidoglycan/LPS O-acetylase OafA/YrhL